MRSPTLQVFALCLLAGCSKFSPSDICARRAVTQCAFLYGCCDPLERYQVAGFNDTNPTMHVGADDVLGFVVQVNDEPTQSGCENAVTAACNTELAYLNAAADEGRITVDETAVDNCLKPLEDALDSCEPNAYFNFDPAEQDSCKKLITGTVVGGGDCYSSAECAAEGSICEPVPDMSTGPDAAPIRRLLGVCKAPPQLGQACQNNQCAPSLYCDNQMMKCAAKIGLNGDCANGTCQDDLYCDQANHCVAAPGAGQPCANPPFRCGPDLECRDGTCRPNSTPPIYQYCDGT